jgi:hypothetical protein
VRSASAARSAVASNASASVGYTSRSIRLEGTRPA